MRAIEASKATAIQQSQDTLAEVGLRKDLMQMRSERDQARGKVQEAARRLTLVEDDLQQTKANLSKITKEKIQLERDQRATLSLAKSLQGNASTDVDYYKRKVCAVLPYMTFRIETAHDYSPASPHVSMAPFTSLLVIRLQNSIPMFKGWATCWPKRIVKLTNFDVNWNEICHKIDWLKFGQNHQQSKVASLSKKKSGWRTRAPFVGLL